MLSYSRFAFIDFSADQRQPTIFRRMVQAFESFGGVPAEIVFDSMPGIVDRWEMGSPILNLRAIDFAAHYGFSYHIAPRGDGAYKGKVERPFRFMETSFFNGRTLFSMPQARAALRNWLDNTANPRMHRKTRKHPVEQLVIERPKLDPLPAAPYDTRELAYRIVDGYGHIPFDGNQYGSPSTFGGRRVVVRADEHTVELYEERGAKLCEHPRAPRGAQQTIVTPGRSKRKHRVDTSVLMGVFEGWGDEAAAFAKELTERQRTSRHQLAEILALQDRYSADDIVGALVHATKYRAYDAPAVARILEARATPRRFSDRVDARIRAHVRDTMAALPVTRREPNEYARLLGSPTHISGKEATDGEQDTEQTEDSEDTPD